VLKTLGFARRQVSTAVVVQATALAALALALGLPLGVALGRWGWTAVAERLHVLPVATVPAVALALVVPGTLLVANLAAAWPAWSARRTSPATALRSE
jgi:ABC-type antimicrobial peptide transport system permease subunit